MAKLTDLIEQLLKEMIEENGGAVEITRGALAERVQCVPSQITYVLSTRFTHGHGYIVESRRGGGGWIRIQRVDIGGRKSSFLMHAINSLGTRLSQMDAHVFLRNFMDEEVLEPEIARLIFAAISDQSLFAIPQPLKDAVRMHIFKNMVLQLALDLQQAESEVAARKRRTAAAVATSRGKQSERSSRPHPEMDEEM